MTLLSRDSPPHDTPKESKWGAWEEQDTHRERQKREMERASEIPQDAVALQKEKTHTYRTNMVKEAPARLDSSHPPLGHANTGRLRAKVIPALRFCLPDLLLLLHAKLIYRKHTEKKEGCQDATS